MQGRYAFAFPQRVRDADVDIRPYRSNTDLEIGYFVTPSLRVLALGAGQITHTGIDFIPPGQAATPFTFAQRQHHDQIGRENFLNVGVGAAFDVSDSVALFGSFLKQVAGRNGHALDHVISIGVTYSFRRNADEILMSKTDSRERPLIRCVCQKAVTQ